MSNAFYQKKCLSVCICIGKKSELGMRSCLMEMPRILASLFPIEAIKVAEDVVILVLIVQV